MGEWNVDAVSEPGVLRLRLSGRITAQEIAAFVAAHNQAIDSLMGGDYKVWCDLRQLEPLDPECALLFEQAKRYSQSRPNFRGSSVLVSSSTIGLQHRLTSIRSGVMSTELISDDEAALREHLRTVYRRSG
ncbi:MAG: hypothetical protein U1A78_20435 [Polyangia bacterium]